MNPRLKALHQKLQAHIDEANALGALAELTDEQRARAEALPGLISAVRQEIEAANALANLAASSNEFLNGQPTANVIGGGMIAGQTANLPGVAASLEAVVGTLQPLGTAIQQGQGMRVLDPTTVAVISRGRAKHFKGASQMEANLKAYRFGMFALATLKGSASAREFCQNYGIPIRAGHTEGVNEDGGFLVPHEFDNDLIDLREEYGLFRQWAKNKTMGSETKSVPRRTGGIAAYFKGETEAATEAKKGWDNVNLIAKKLLAYAKFSTELGEDAIIDLGDDLANEIAYAFAEKEDNAGFNGDGTSGYGGIVGVRPKLRGVDATIGNIKGLVVASGNAYSEIILSDFNKVVGRLPQYAAKRNPAWYVHKTFYHEVMERIMLASGGVTAAEIAAGRKELVFMGYPVRISQTLPSVEANSQVCALFGSLELAAMFGDRRGTTIAMSEHAEFDSDEIAVRGTERFDVNVHDVGNTTVAGPMVGLITAAA